MSTTSKPRKKREWSPFCPDPRQLDLLDHIDRVNDELKRRAFERLDQAIEQALEDASLQERRR